MTGTGERAAASNPPPTGEPLRESIDQLGRNEPEASARATLAASAKPQRRQSLVALR